MTITEIGGAIFILGVFIHTMTYGVWTWKNKNGLGAVMIFLLAFSIMILPLYTVFIRGRE